MVEATFPYSITRLLSFSHYVQRYMIHYKNDLSELEEQRLGRDKSSLINHDYINGGEYRRKFDCITNNSDLARLMYQQAKKFLEHRSGTQYEDMCWIDLNSITVVAEETTSKKERQINYSKKTKKVVKEYDNLLTIHSHPNSTPPSLDDINSNVKWGYNLGIVVCHNGTIYVYSSEEIISKTLFGLIASEYVSNGYDKDQAHLLTLQKLASQGHIMFKEVTINGVRK